MNNFGEMKNSQESTTVPYKLPESAPFLSPSSTKSESDAFCVTVIHEPLQPSTSGRDIASFEKEQDERRKEGGWRNYLGILLALFAGFIFTIGTVLAKYMKHYHPFTLAMYRVQGILFPSIFMIWFAVRINKIKVAETIWPLTEKGKRITLFWVIIRSAFGCTALFLHFGALKYLQVGDLAVLNSCKPIFVTIAAFIFLGEICGCFPVLMALLTMIGVGVITRPPILTGRESFDQDTLIGAGFALASVITDTFVVVIIRSLKRIHVSIMMFFVGLWATIQSVICAALIGELKLPENGRDWVFALSLALVAILNQAAMHLALQFEQANPVAVTRTMDFIFAFILQFLVMGVEPDLFSFCGAAIIILCVLLTAFRKKLTTLPESHRYRKQFWFILK